MANSNITPGTCRKIAAELPPPGYAWLVDSAGNYIVDVNGNKIVVKAS